MANQSTLAITLGKRKRKEGGKGKEKERVINPKIVELQFESTELNFWRLCCGLS